MGTKEKPSHRARRFLLAKGIHSRRYEPDLRQPSVWKRTPTAMRPAALQLRFPHFAHRRQLGCQPYAPAAIYPPEDSWYSFLLEAEWNSRP
jgi:hypothetical protein